MTWERLRRCIVRGVRLTLPASSLGGAFATSNRHGEEDGGAEAPPAVNDTVLVVLNDIHHHNHSGMY